MKPEAVGTEPQTVTQRGDAAEDSAKAKLRVLSLFSGIGGLDLGLERSGMEIVAHSEIDPYASKVLAKHWPDVPNLGDVTEIQEFPQVEVVAGGFPCQDISSSGKRSGVAGARSGLYGQVVRAIRMVRPRYALLENVDNLRIINNGKDMGRVLGDLAEIGLHTEWDCVSASALGAPHLRERIFLVAHADPIRPDSSIAGLESRGTGVRDRLADGSGDSALADSESERRGVLFAADEWQASGEGNASANDCEAGRVRTIFRTPRRSDAWDDGEPVAGGGKVRLAPPSIQLVVDGLPGAVVEPALAGLGNAVAVPVAEHVGRCLVAFAAESDRLGAA